jgi:uncharacterized protein (DUF58 family)
MSLRRDELESAHRSARSVAERLRLSIGAQKGLAGNWLGVGIGSSIDYQDHRPFLTGDDPRYLDWKAYARTGQLTMKVYREEVTPQVDLLFDASASMFFEPGKRRRALELLYFVVESALRMRAAVACWMIGKRARRIEVDDLMAHELALDAGPAGEMLELSQVGLRARSLRVVVSDLLYPGDARGLVSALAARKGRGIVIAPFCAAESDPDWEGNRELVDVESGGARVQRISGSALERYRDAYARHFEIWRDECRRHDVLLARVGAEGELEASLRPEAMRQGAVAPWR